MAGMTALSSANPYPVITLGDGINDEKKRTVKYVNERDDSMMDNLNP